MRNNQSIFFIQKTFELAKKGVGYVSPNPLVGAILVKNSNIIGQSYHKKFGSAHAEANAIESASESVEGSTLYCNLEPCCHYNKKTPPCAQRIVKEGIKKVIISNLDPNPGVSGKGVELLKNAGLDVVEGILKNDGEELNKFYFNFIKNKTPYITIKIAQSLDGFIYSEKSKNRWISGKESRKLVHLWRSDYDAVLIGAQTVIVDNPKLTVRDTTGRNPYRIIIDGKLRVSPNSKIFNLENPEKTIIFTGINADKKTIKLFQKKGINIHQLEESNQTISLKTILKELGKLNITSLLVEGGNQIFSQFLSKNLSNELKIFISPNLLGSGIPAVKLESEFKINLSKTEKIGKDLLATYLP
jgi:diaminohydroxyphosphoribosylaminopyrimidine deaminase / 5-amino-6-(5-phosphoribosylamino)uracil reductase